MSACTDEVTELSGKVVSVERRDDEHYSICCSIQGEKLLCAYYHPLPEYWKLYGKTVSFSAQTEKPKKAGNPRTFDYGLYLKSKGIFYTAVIENFTVSDCPENMESRFRSWIIARREMMLAEIDISSRAGGFVRSVLFGDTSDLDEDIYKDFRRNGTAHVLAVSGLHVGILYGVYKALTRKKRELFLLFSLFSS